MKRHFLTTAAASAALLLVAACGSKTPDEQLRDNLAAGEYTKAEKLLDSLIAGAGDDFEKALGYIQKKDSLYKLRSDFRRTKDEMITYVERYYGDSALVKVNGWIKDGTLEYRVIDGDTLFFRNAAPNVFRVDKEAIARASVGDDGGRSQDSVLNANLPEILAAPSGQIAAPKKMKVRHHITVKADAVPAGDTLRVWIPMPRPDVPRQTDVQLLGSSDSVTVSPLEYGHYSAYMERVAEAGKPTEFYVDYQYTCWGQHFDLEGVEIAPYDTTSAVYKQYTAVRAPHLLQSESMRQLAAEIVGDETHPYLKLRKIFDYVKQYPWASALNYSIIDDIPQYVLDNKKGDCGQVALLLINLARAAGIPARWQSGLMMHPGAWNMHDWAEVYYEGIGWTPVDVSFGRNQTLTNEGGAQFFDSGIDSYRMVANSDYSCGFYPPKKYPASDTVDFQAGEVETSDGNLFYDKWSWGLDIDYLD